MTVSEKLQIVVAVLLGVFGVVILAGVCIGLVEGTSKYSLVTDVMLTILFGILPIVCGITHVQGVMLNHTIFAREERPARRGDCTPL